jgi:hypothetical protein
LLQFAHRQESVQQFAKRHRVSVSSLYRWQSEQTISGFVQIKPEPTHLQATVPLVLEKGDLRIEFSTLPHAVYLQSILECLLLC